MRADLSLVQLEHFASLLHDIEVVALGIYQRAGNLQFRICLDLTFAEDDKETEELMLEFMKQTGLAAQRIIVSFQETRRFQGRVIGYCVPPAYILNWNVTDLSDDDREHSMLRARAKEYFKNTVEMSDGTTIEVVAKGPFLEAVVPAQGGPVEEIQAWK